MAVTFWALHSVDVIDATVLALGHTDLHLTSGALGATPEELMELLDGAVRGPKFAHRLDSALMIVDHTAARVANYSRDLAVRNHFDHIFDVLKRQLTPRYELGWRTPLGAPPHGTPFPFLDAQSQSDLGGTYECPTRFQDWVQLREEFNYRWRNSDHKRALARRWLQGRALLP
jgi:hypothetical protein